MVRLDPVAAAQLMIDNRLEPLTPYPGAAELWACRCMGCGRAVHPRYNNIKRGWGGCRACGAAARGVAARLPEQEATAAMRSAGLNPIDPYPGRKRPWRCRCAKCGKVVSPRLDGILAGQTGCKWCAKRAVDSVVAARVMAAAGLEPLEAYPGAVQPWRCRCLGCNAEVTPRYNNVRQGHSGCARCRHKETAGASQRLAPDVAVALMLERGLEPLEPYRNSTDPWRCRCMTCGTETSPRYTNVKQGWGACPTCKGIAQSARQRRPEESAVAVMRTAGIEPLEPFRTNRTPWRGRCLTCGKEVSPTLGSVMGGQGPCKWCAKKSVDPAEAERIMRDAGLLPLVDYRGAHAPWPCRCRSCGETVAPTYGSIQRGQGGCRWCAGYGFDMSAPAFVYLIAHPIMGAIKVGIGNTAANRLGQHANRGWQTLVTVPALGRRALSIEKTVLASWRNELGLPPYLSKAEMPQEGWTETVDADAIDIPATIDWIRRLAAE